MKPAVTARPSRLNHAVCTICESGLVSPSFARIPASWSVAMIQIASATSAAAKNAADALVKNASAVATPAKSPHSPRRSPTAYAAHPTVISAVIVDSISAARFHITHVKSTASSAPPINATRRPVNASRVPHSADSPSINAPSASTPEATGTVRACQVPTPNAENTPYSSAVKTGAT